MNLQYSSKAKKQLLSLPKDVQLKILDKMDFYFQQDEPLIFAKTLSNQEPMTHRFRVGKYRALGIIIKVDNVFLVVKIGLRASIYD